VTTHLAKATRCSNEVRATRSKFKRDIKAGEVLISKLLIETAGGVADWLETFEVAHLLSAMEGVSFEMGCELCETLRIPPLKTVGAMTYRQRRVIASHVAEWEKSAVPSGGKRAVAKRHEALRGYARPISGGRVPVRRLG